MKANHLFGTAVVTIAISLGAAAVACRCRYSDSGVDMIDGREVNTAPLVNKELAAFSTRRCAQTHERNKTRPG